MATIHVQVVNPDRKVVVAEWHAAHPGESDDGNEIWVVGYPDEENIYEVGDTPLVRQRIAEGALIVVSGAGSKPAQQARQQPAQETETQRANRLADEKAAADKSKSGR